MLRPGSERLPCCSSCVAQRCGGTWVIKSCRFCSAAQNSTSSLWSPGKRNAMPITAIGAEFSGRRLFFKAEGDLVTLKLAEDGKGCGLYLHTQCRVMILGKQLETPCFAFPEVPGLRKEKKIARTLQAGTKKYVVIAALLAQLCLLARAGLSLLTQIRHFWQ